MTVEQNLLQALKASADVLALTDGRIYFDRADEGAAAPFITLVREATGQQQTLSSVVDNPDVVFDLRCWAATRLQAEELATLCANACALASMGLGGREAGYSDEYALHAAILKVTLD